jgi:ProP effector
MLRNRHPADALADVRAEIKQLQIVEAELRADLINAYAAGRRGLGWLATVRATSRSGLDLDAAIEHFGREALQPFMRKITVTNVRLKRVRRADVEELLQQQRYDLSRQRTEAAELSKRQRVNPGPVIGLLAKMWPKCFSVYEGRRRPLKVGIKQDILAALAKAAPVSKPVRDRIAVALRSYVSNRVYLSRMRAGAARVGLDGKPAGTVSAEEAQHAADRAAQLALRKQQRREAQKGPHVDHFLKAAPAPAPPRVSLSDLRAAGQSRRTETAPKDAAA